MKNDKLFILLGVMCFIPWGFLFKSFGLQIQLFGLFIQIVGLSLLIIKNKNIF